MADTDTGFNQIMADTDTGIRHLNAMSPLRAKKQRSFHPS